MMSNNKLVSCQSFLLVAVVVLLIVTNEIKYINCQLSLFSSSPPPGPNSASGGAASNPSSATASKEAIFDFENIDSFENVNF